ncbi:MAG: SUMF1/EgtB/PvdO family nonheme iron enzyme [Verrucomicrobia bacterium]|nr:SUMF1/EgtB/PvdO family nonheme iron enzyme [Verrucomicrobiota bacterium]
MLSRMAAERLDPDATQRLDDAALGATLASGQRVFGRYVLESEIGRGGMGVVWRARDETLGETMALKFLPASVARDAVAVDELKEETRKARRLRHPNIVTVFDFVQDATMVAVSMELVDGTTLAQLRLQQPGKVFSSNTLAPLIPQICSALDYAHHDAKVAHRDLKPANVLVTRDSTAKLADFGIARSLTETHTRLTGKAGTSGTLLYMSPQQLRGRHATAADNIYALGATLYELFAGKPPFFSGELVHQILREAPEPLSVRRAEFALEASPVPRAWVETIAACLAKERKDRPQSAGEVAARLRGERGLKRRATPGRRALWVTFASAAVPALLAVVFWPGGNPAAAEPKRSAEPWSPLAPPQAGKLQPALEVRKSDSERGLKPGRLTIRAEPREIELTINGRAVRSEEITNGELTLPTGESLALVAAAKGYKSATRTLTLPANGRDTWVVALEKLRGPEVGQRWTIPDLNLELVPIAPGTFTMGERNGAHQVTLTRPFWLGKTEITQREWQAVMGNNPSNFKGENLPVETVSWKEATEFCRKLTARERAADRLPEGYAYTLPTEAQWEFACRAGTTGDYAGDVDAMAWYAANSGNQTHAVGTKRANAWGLREMHGNVWEWCLDWYGAYLGGSVRDPVGPSSGSDRVGRGGGWGDAAQTCRAAYRSRNVPGFCWLLLGFRLALVYQSLTAPVTEKDGHGRAEPELVAGKTAVRITMPSQPPGITVVDQNVRRITVGPDWKNAERTFVRKDYTDTASGMLRLETKVTLKIVDATSNPWKVQEFPGERREWNFSIRVSGERKTNRSVSFLLTVNSGGSTSFTIKSWEVIDASGVHAPVKPSVDRPEAVATFTKRGKYDVFAVGETDWGTSFRIKGPVIDAYP